MGCGLSVCRKWDQQPGSPSGRSPIKHEELADVLIPDEGDDADNELQQLEDENKREDDHSYSPPPTMDESMSDRGSPPIPIAAIVTLKNLPVVESPRTINISSPVERLNSPEASVSLNIESMSRPDSATVDAVTTSTPRDTEFEEQIAAVPTDKEGGAEVTDMENKEEGDDDNHLREAALVGGLIAGVGAAVVAGALLAGDEGAEETPQSEEVETVNKVEEETLDEEGHSDEVVEVTQEVEIQNEEPGEEEPSLIEEAKADEESENQETNLGEEPANQETNVEEESANQETNVEEEPANQEANVEEETENQEANAGEESTEVVLVEEDQNLEETAGAEETNNGDAEVEVVEEQQELQNEQDEEKVDASEEVVEVDDQQVAADDAAEEPAEEAPIQEEELIEKNEEAVAEEEQTDVDSAVLDGEESQAQDTEEVVESVPVADDELIESKENLEEEAAGEENIQVELDNESKVEENLDEEVVGDENIQADEPKIEEEAILSESQGEVADENESVEPTETQEPSNEENVAEEVVENSEENKEEESAVVNEDETTTEVIDSNQGEESIALTEESSTNLIEAEALQFEEIVTENDGQEESNIETASIAAVDEEEQPQESPSDAVEAESEAVELTSTIENPEEPENDENVNLEEGQSNIPESDNIEPSENEVKDENEEIVAAGAESENLIIEETEAGADQQDEVMDDINSEQISLSATEVNEENANETNTEENVDENKEETQIDVIDGDNPISETLPDDEGNALIEETAAELDATQGAEEEESAVEAISEQNPEAEGEPEAAIEVEEQEIKNDEIEMAEEPPASASMIENDVDLIGDVENIEGDQTFNDEEEEIWRKLQKDIEMEENDLLIEDRDEEEPLAQVLENEEVELIEEKEAELLEEETAAAELALIDGELVEETPSNNEKVQENDDGVTEALAGVTETIAKVAMFMIDTPMEGNNAEEPVQVEQNNEDVTAEETQETLVDIKDEPFSNGEPVEDIQMVDKYEIKTDSINEPEDLETEMLPEDSEIPVSEETKEEQSNLDAIKEEDDQQQGPEKMFELHITSNETTKDGLVESSCQPRVRGPHSTEEVFYPQDQLDEKDDSKTADDDYEAAAIKIQAGYRGYRDRKALKDSQLPEDHPNLNEKDDLPRPKISSGAKVLSDEWDDDRYNAAAIKIQAGFRGHRERQQLKRGRDDVVDDEPAEIEEVENIITDSIEEQQKAATKIQSKFRGNQDRKKLREIKRPQEKCAIKLKTISLPDDGMEEEAIAATKIQANYRGYRERKQHKRRPKVDPEVIHYPESIEEYQIAATKIQAGYRGFRDRKNLKKHSPIHKGNHEEETDSQSGGSCGNLHVMDPVDRENDAATKIQANYRGFRTRRELNRRKSAETKRTDSPAENVMEGGTIYDDEDDAAAVKIQARYRGYRVRKNKEQQQRAESPASENVMEGPVYDDGDDAAAVKIQARYRGYRVRKNMEETQKALSPEESEETLVDDTIGDDDDDQNAAAVKIQARYRGYRVRKNMNEKEEAIENKEDNSSLDRETAAAVKIQAGYRGFRVRKNMNRNKSPTWVSKHRGLVQSRRGSLPEDRKIQHLLQHESFVNRRDSDPSMVMKKNNTLSTSIKSSESCDDDRAQAAIKIQSNFRGYQARKKMKKQLS